jgi:hypothetical protein
LKVGLRGELQAGAKQGCRRDERGHPDSHENLRRR